jgi:hypothetical protein
VLIALQLLGGLGDFPFVAGIADEDPQWLFYSDGMGFFDTYIPRPALMCPVRGRELRDWQGKDGPRLLLVWEQGIRLPRNTSLEGDVEGLTLPEEFLIYSYDCQCFPRGVEAVGRCVDGVWQSTALLTADLVERFYYFLPKSERQSRIERLRKAGL